METSKQLQFLYKRSSESKYHNILMQDFGDFNLNIDSKLFQFAFSTYEPKDSNGVTIIPEPGDDVIITTDRTYTKVFSDIFAGGVQVVSDIYGNLLDDGTRQKASYDLTIIQRNFALETMIFETLEVITLNDFLYKLFEKSRPDLGGIMNGGLIVPKYTLKSANIELSPMSLQGDPMDILAEVLKSIGYNYRIRYVIEPDNNKTVNLIQTYDIFDKQGYQVLSNDWNNGITLKSVYQGLVLNPDFLIKQNYKYLLAETDLVYTKDALVSKNWFDLRTKIKNLTNLKRYDEVSTDGVKDTFVFGKAYDVKYVAIRTIGTIETINSSTDFTCELETSKSLLRYQERLVNNQLGDKLVILIKPSPENSLIPVDGVFKEITVDPNYTIYFDLPFTDIRINDSIELVNGFSKVAENYDDLGNYDVLPADANGYVITHISENDSLSSIKFTEIDKPGKDQQVIVYFYGVDDNPQERVFPVEVSKYDLKVMKDELPYSISESDLQNIYSEYTKLTKPLETIKLISYRPTLVSVGSSLPVNLPRTQSNFIVTDLTALVVGYSYYGNQPVIRQSITLSLYKNNLEDLFASFKNRDTIAKTKIKQRRYEILYSTLEYVSSLVDIETGGANIATPVALPATSISNTAFTVNTTAVTGATGYILYIFTNPALTVTLLGYTGGVDVGNITSYTVNQAIVASEPGPFYYFFFAYNNTSESEFSNVITVNKFTATTALDVMVNPTTGVYDNSTFANTVVAISSPSIVTDAYGTGLNLDSGSKAIKVNDSSSFEFPNHFTGSMTFRKDSTNTIRLAQKGFGEQFRFGLRTNNNTFWLFGSSGYPSASVNILQIESNSYSFITGRVYKIAWCLDLDANTFIYLIKDTVSNVITNVISNILSFPDVPNDRFSSISAMPALLNDGSDMYIGNDNSSNQPVGIVYRFRLFTTALSESILTSLL